MGTKKKLNHGEFISSVMERSGKSISEIIDLSGYSRTSIYRWMTLDDLDMEKIHRICNACGIDVTGELPELDYYRSIKHIDDKYIEPQSNVIPNTKYIDLLEQLNDVRSKLEETQERYYAAIKRVEVLERERKNKDSTGTNEG